MSKSTLSAVPVSKTSPRRAATPCDIAARVAHAAGVRTLADLYRFYFELPKHSVHRVWASLERLNIEMSLSTSAEDSSEEDPQAPEGDGDGFKIPEEPVLSNIAGDAVPDAAPDVTPDAFSELYALAQKVRVGAAIADRAVRRYCNPLERVMRVLSDLGSLLEAGCDLRCPQALFTKLMRSGEEVLLPQRVVAAREALEEKRLEAKRLNEQGSKLVPGALILWYGRTRARVQNVLSTLSFATIELLEDSADGWAGDFKTVAVSQLRF